VRDAHQTTVDIPAEGRLPPNIVVAKRRWVSAEQSNERGGVFCRLLLPPDAAD
jgi:hypothetical protein